MTITRITVLVISYLFIFLNNAISQIKISGKIKDFTNKPIAYATIELLQDSVDIQVSYADSIGNYKLENIRPNAYILVCNYIGKKHFTYPFTILKDTVIDITLKADATSDLKEVTVVAKKPLIEKQVDRLIFNVDRSIMATSGDALDALKVTPFIKVKDDAIAMIGKAGLSVMVNDRLVQFSGEDLINFLRTIKGENIKSIEVITNPPAKYDAEGNSGLVNIVLKKAKLNSWSVAINSGYKQATYSTFNNGVNFNYQKNKITFFADVNYINGSKKGVETEQIGYQTETWYNDFNRRPYSNVFTGRIGVDYEVSKNWMLGAQYLGSINKPEINQDGKTIITENFSQQLDSIIASTSQDYKKINANSFNVHSLINLDSSGKKVSFDLDYFNYDNKINRAFQTQNSHSDYTPTVNGYSSAKNSGVQNVDIYSFKVDFIHPLKWMKLTYGGKVYFSDTKYDNQYFHTTTGKSILDVNQSNVFKYKENTRALYVSASKKLKKKWEFKLGLRAENTQTTGSSITLNQKTSNNYIQFFPTAYTQYVANDENVFSLSFGRRLSRPRYNELNPFKVFYNAYNYSQGNPLLVPAISNNIEFQHSYKDVLISSLSFSKTTNGIGNPPFFDEQTKISYLLDINYYTSYTYNLTETYVFDKLKWLESENQINIFYTATHVNKNLDLKNTKGLGAYFSTNNNFILNKQRAIRGELNFWYQTPQYEDIYKRKYAAGLDAGFRIALLKSNLLLSLTIQDILRTDIQKASTTSDNTKYSYTDYSDSRYFKISMSYKFGSQKLNVNHRNFGNEEEKRRAE